MTSLATKTVILMDHSQALNNPGGIQVEIDLGSMGASRMRSRKSTGEEDRYSGANYYFFPPVMKSLWTCAVENVIEYARIVYDVFSDERLLRILMCQSNHGQTCWLNSWEPFPVNASGKASGTVSQQSLAFITEAFANAGPPPPLKKQSFTGSTAGLHTGIKAAIEGLSQPSAQQTAMINSSIAAGKVPVKPINRGRVICITSCTTEALGQISADDLEDFFITAVTSQNRIASASDHLLPIIECELVLLSLHPIGQENSSRVLSRPLHDISNSVRAEVYVITPDKLNDKIVEICAAHHDLVTSTVTNIPMKEEQNAVSSSNYDVPLFHAKMSSSSEETRMLKWSTPTAAKNGSGLCPGGVIPMCASATRITPVDVNSRPSTCLSNFVVNGRSVWLELPTRKGKQATHVLTPHGPEMWMHVMEARNTLEDLPAISEGVGGRITDYRITDFVEFIKSNILIPYPKSENLPKTKYEKDGGSFVRRRSNSIEDGKKPTDLAKARLLRRSTYWPLTLSGSILFALSAHIDKLLSLVPKESLSEMEKLECDKVIYALMSLEVRGDAPPVPSSHFRKGMKRDEQWKVVYGELETFIRANLHSDLHKKVLECLLDSRSSTDKSAPVSDPRLQDSGNGDKGRSKDLTVDSALSELKHITSTPKSPVVTDSPMSPPMLGSMDTVDHNAKLGRPNLLTLFMQKTEKRDLRTLVGGKLYPHLAAANTDQEMTGKSRKSEA